MYTLLIVDDEPAILEGMQHILDWESYGFTRIATARNTADGLARAIELNPDICLLDVCVGDDKGYELINRLNVLGVRSNYIMMSGYGEFTYAIESMRRGAKEYLLKPVETKKLEAAVEKIVVEELGGSVEGLRRADRDADPVLQRRYDEFPPLLGKILRIVAAEYGQKITLRSTADRFRMNSTYLGQLFLKETGLKFSEYLMLYRLGRARELIENTDEKIVSIASEVGYQNLNYFYSHFHSYYGISPSEMRAAAQNKSSGADNTN
ncbi:MAG: response regulator [Oscillospiraceae bacterium]